MLLFLLGAICGAFIGVLLMCLLSVRRNRVAKGNIIEVVEYGNGQRHIYYDSGLIEAEYEERTLS
jgi:hypothetical protein